MPVIHYPAVIDRSASGFGVSFPDFPGCIAAGDTVNEAALNAELALAMHLKALFDDKDPLPEPTALDAIEDVEGADDVAHILVRAETPGKISRIQITLEDALIAAIDARSSNRSGFLASAAWAALRHQSADSPWVGVLRQAAETNAGINEMVHAATSGGKVHARSVAGSALNQSSKRGKRAAA